MLRKMRGLGSAVVSIILVLSPSPGRADEVFQLEQLLNYFSASCPTQGEWTRAAINQASQLISTLQSVQNDPACQSLAGAVSQLGLLSQRIAALENDFNQRQLFGLKKEQETLLLQLSNTNDPVEISIIESQLRALQVDIATLEGYQDFNEDYAYRDRSSALSNLVLNTNVILNQALANQNCLIKNPSLLSGLASLAGSVYAPLATSGISLAISAGVELLGSIIEWARKNEIAKEIDRIAEGIAASAYQCVLESLSNQWCSAQDALHVIDLKTRARNVSDPLWIGVRLLDRELPNFLEWLELVRSGADPTNPYEAERQNSVFRREASIKTTRAAALGTINESKILFAGSETSLQKWVIERSAIQDIVGQIYYGNPYGNPMTDVYDTSYAPYYLVGLQKNEVPQDLNNGIIKPFSQFDPFTEWPGGGFTPELDNVIKRFELWVAEGQKKLDAERDAAFFPDVLQVFDDAVTAKTFGYQKGLSPMTSIERLIQFLLNQMPDKLAPPTHQRIYEDTIQRLKNILEQIQVSENPSTEEELKMALQAIYREMQLDHGTSLIYGRLNRSIRISLSELVLSGTGDLSQQQAAQFLAADDIVNELQRHSPRGNLSMIRMDIFNSQRITENTLDRVFSAFGKEIRIILEKISEKATKEKNLNGKYTIGRAQFCFSLMAIPSWAHSNDRNAKTTRALCLGSQIPSLFIDAPSSAILNRSFLEEPYEKRTCELRNFFRREKIYQDYADTDDSGIPSDFTAQP